MAILKSSKWRQQFKVHPAADVFPMMEGEELSNLATDIKTNGLKTPIEVRRHGNELELIEGRCRFEAMERAGIAPGESDIKEIELEDDEVVAYVISANIRRRHLTKQERADIIVAAAKMAIENKPGQVGPVSDDAELDEIPPGLERRQSRLGGRGKKNPVKEQALKLNQALPKENRPSTRTIKRSLAKAEGKKAKPQTPQYTPKPLPKPKSGEPVLGREAARRIYLDLCTGPDVDLDEEQAIVIGGFDYLREIRRQAKTNGAEKGGVAMAG